MAMGYKSAHIVWKLDEGKMSLWIVDEPDAVCLCKLENDAQYSLHAPALQETPDVVQLALVYKDKCPTSVL